MTLRFYERTDVEKLMALWERCREAERRVVPVIHDMQKFLLAELPPPCEHQTKLILIGPNLYHRLSPIFTKRNIQSEYDGYVGGFEDTQYHYSGFLRPAFQIPNWTFFIVTTDANDALNPVTSQTFSIGVEHE